MNTIDLSGTWKLRAEFLDVAADRFYEVSHREDGPFTMLTKAPGYLPSRSGYLEAHAPCDVITALVEGGILEEPLDACNTEKCQWLADFSWWFLRDFDVPEAMLAHEEVRLLLETLDYDADIIVNGRIIAQHRNAFRPFHEDVKRFLHAGSNQIIVRLTTGLEKFYPMDTMAYYGSRGDDHRVYLRKAQYTYGWDWCKKVPTCGMGGKLQLEGISGANVLALRCDTLAASTDSATLRVSAEIENVSMCTSDDATLRVQLCDGEDVVCAFERELHLVGGLNFVEETVQLAHPKLWWPNGYGAQPLYTLTAQVTCRGVRNEAPDRRIGIRTLSIDMARTPDGGRRFDFLVNGARVFCKGGNWVPADSVYLRVPPEKYEALVREAAACNFTMLRMWGGGLYEPDCFYDACSRYGILLMHDFMYACAYYPDQLDWFVHEAVQEAEYQTKRLAHQPCMAIWTGNNEIHESFDDWFDEAYKTDYLYGTQIFNYRLPEIVHRNAPLTPYMPCSPFFGDKANDMMAGDCHLWKWTNPEQPTGFRFAYELEAFDRLAAKVRFSSEYGFWGALPYSSVERFHAGAPIDMDGAIWAHHGEHAGKRARILETLDRHLVDPAKLDARGYLLYSGILQGMLYEELALALRRREHCAGDLIWMYNDCWPETGWTIIDYYLTRKPSFYFLKRAFAPRKLIVRAMEGEGTIVALNERPEAWDTTIECGFLDFAGAYTPLGEHRVSVPAFGRVELAPFAATRAADEGFYCVRSADGEMGTSLRGYYRDVPLPEAHVRIESESRDGGNLTLRLRSDAFAPVVYIKAADDRTHMSDNFFPMLPGVEVAVTLCDCEATPEVIAVPFEGRGA